MGVMDRATHLLKAARRRASDRYDGKPAPAYVIERREEQARRINKKQASRRRKRGLA